MFETRRESAARASGVEAVMQGEVGEDRTTSLCDHDLTEHQRGRVPECGETFDPLLGWTFKKWNEWVRSGGDVAPNAVDDQEYVFGDRDFSPTERRGLRLGLREFLLQGQKTWRKDGGVVLKPRGMDPVVKEILTWVEKGERRRPATVLRPGENPLPFVGTFWELEDFVGIKEDIFNLLVECQRLEREAVKFVRERDTFHGHQINEEGCRLLGIPEDTIREWMDWVSFEYDSELPHYSKPPYANIGESLEVFRMALEEVNRNLLLGKILPLSVIPWIENRTTAVMKVAPLEPSGVKWRTCVDLTASGVNQAVESW
eukprot:1394762-Rhodomonas_salina.2